jgi:hypothetical protein
VAYLFGLIVVAFLLVVLHYFTELDARQKGGAVLVLALLVGGAIAYNNYTNAQSAHVRNIEMRYGQGETIVCDGIEVNASNFSLSIGTQTFIGKEGSGHYNRMFRISECR